MAADSVTTIGGKGTPLSSASVYSIANGIGEISIDPWVLNRFDSSNNQASLVKQCYPGLLGKSRILLTIEESRASFVILLKKLILLSGLPGIRTVLPLHIMEALNLSLETISLDSLDLTEEEVAALCSLELSSTMHGISAVLDCQLAALSTVADVAAALSSEAASRHAKDMKIVLNGSTLVGEVERGEALSSIPIIQGCLREQAKFVHSKTRINLNSVPKVGPGSAAAAAAAAVYVTLLPLVPTLSNLGNSSLSSIKLNLDMVSSNEVQSALVGLYKERCPCLENGLTPLYSMNFQVFKSEDYCMFVHYLNELLGIVWKIVAWEVITAFVVLEGAKWNEKNQGALKLEKESESEKAIGTPLIVQEIKQRLQSRGEEAIVTSGSFIDVFLSVLDPKHLDFSGLLNTMKKIMENNETRRKTPKGTRDFASEQMAIRKKAFSIIEEVFERHGAEALDTPVFELRETLMGKYGEDSKLIYDLADQGGELCSLRYDLTVPFARYVAINGLTSFKRYQIGKVYRRENPSNGRFREFYQCDFDIAGQDAKMGPDFEVIKILTELLDELQIEDYEIKLSHRELLDGILELCGVPREKFRTICSSIDKLDKEGFDMKREMVEDKGLTAEVADMISNFVGKKGRPLELIYEFKQEDHLFMKNKSSKKALDDLDILFNALEKSKCINKVVFDLSLARGLDYYTGVIFEAVLPKMKIGSIAGGGRYDNLIGTLGKKEVPAVGVCLGIERVLNILEEKQTKNEIETIRATKTEVLVSILGDNDDLLEAAELVSELWNAKVKAEYSLNKRISKHFDIASKYQIPWMIIVGERERKQGIVKLKDLKARKEVDIPRSLVVEQLQKRLKFPPN